MDCNLTNQQTKTSSSIMNTTTLVPSPVLRIARLLLLLATSLLPVHHAAAQPTALRISGLRHFYSTPYLLDFNFSIRDENNRVVVLDPSLFTVVCKENGAFISASETGFRLLADNKQLECYVILDYTLSMLDPVINGDANGDSKSDSAEAMEQGAKILLSVLRDDAEVGLFEFHRADAGFPPQKVADLMRDKAYLTNQIDRTAKRHPDLVVEPVWPDQRLGIGGNHRPRWRWRADLAGIPRRHQSHQCGLSVPHAGRHMGSLLHQRGTHQGLSHGATELAERLGEVGCRVSFADGGRVGEGGAGWPQWQTVSLGRHDQP